LRHCNREFAWCNAAILPHESTFEISKENAMTQNAWKFAIAASLVSAWTLASVPLVGQSLSSVTQPVQVVNTPNVNVVNTPSVSVTNAPNVSVTNTPSVNVANSPTVSLAGGASVNVTNPVDGQSNPTPLAVLEATQPYDDNCNLSFSGNGNAHCDFGTLPSGKRLVLQVFETSGQVETGLKPIQIELRLDTVHSFTTTFMGGDGTSDFFATHQETRLYLSSGTPTCYVFLSNVSFLGSFKCVLSGFLVDVP
jgi:hypothetical protein